MGGCVVWAALGIAAVQYSRTSASGAIKCRHLAAGSIKPKTFLLDGRLSRAHPDICVTAVPCATHPDSPGAPYPDASPAHGDASGYGAPGLPAAISAAGAKLSRTWHRCHAQCAWHRCRACSTAVMHIAPLSCTQHRCHAYSTAVIHIAPLSCTLHRCHAYSTAVMHIAPLSCI